MLRKKEKTWLLLVRSCAGLLCPTLDGVYGLTKGAYYFFTNPSQYFYNYKSPKDKAGRTTPFIMAFSRIGVVAVTIVCLLGFFTSLEVRLPGVNPLCATDMIQTTSTFGFLGAMHQSSFWSSLLEIASYTSFWAMMLGRGGGALLGACVDGCVYHIIIKNQLVEQEKIPELAPHIITLKQTHKQIMERMFVGGVPLVLFFGEAGPELVKKVADNFEPLPERNFLPLHTDIPMEEKQPAPPPPPFSVPLSPLPTMKL